MQNAAGEIFPIVSLLFFKAPGKIVIVAKCTSSFVNEEVQPLPTPPQPPRFHLKVAVQSSGPNSTPRSEITVNLHT